MDYATPWWPGPAAEILVAVAVAHLALQWVVHVVVYPGLADQSRAVPAQAAALHARYTSRMAVAVAPVYLALAVSVLLAFAASPRVPTAVAGLLVVAVVGLTGILAVPLHRALSGDRSPDQAADDHRRLYRVDLVRLILAGALVVVSLWAAA